MTDESHLIDAKKITASPTGPKTTMKVQVEFDNLIFVFTGSIIASPKAHMNKRQEAVARALLQSALDELGDNND